MARLSGFRAAGISVATEPSIIPGAVSVRSKRSKVVPDSATSQLHVGTSGWTYRDWRGPFFPADLPQREWLSYYGKVFTTTEINTSFYRTPTLAAVRKWRNETDADFCFAWKASKFITHWKRLGESCANSLRLMETRLKRLGDKLGPVLFQLPNRMKPDRERLARFIDMLSTKRHYAFEFRDPSWYEPQILDLLRSKNIALCISDHCQAPAPWEATADHVYVRLHGPTGRYRDSYQTAALRQFARSIRRWHREGRTVFCYFDNDQKSAAPLDALALAKLLRRR